MPHSKSPGSYHRSGIWHSLRTPVEVVAGYILARRRVAARSIVLLGWGCRMVLRTGPRRSLVRRRVADLDSTVARSLYLLYYYASKLFCEYA